MINMRNFFHGYTNFIIVLVVFGCIASKIRKFQYVRNGVVAGNIVEVDNDNHNTSQQISPQIPGLEQGEIFARNHTNDGDEISLPGQKQDELKFNFSIQSSVHGLKTFTSTFNLSYLVERKDSFSQTERIHFSRQDSGASSGDLRFSRAEPDSEAKKQNLSFVENYAFRMGRKAGCFPERENQSKTIRAPDVSVWAHQNLPYPFIVPNTRKASSDKDIKLPWASIPDACTQIMISPTAGYNPRRMDDRPTTRKISSKFAVHLCSNSSETSGNEIAGVASGRIVVQKLFDSLGCSPPTVGDGNEGGPPVGRLSPVGHPESIMLEAELGARFGPDELEVVLLGPEVLVLDVIYHANCTYSFPYTVGTAGNYKVSIRHIRDRYQALNEMEDAFPPLLNDSVLGESAYIKIEPRGPFASKYPKTKHSTNAVKDSLSACGCDIFEGKSRYVKRKGALEWRPLLQSSAGCQYSPIQIGQAARWLESRRVLMLGDSHMRVFFNSFANFVCGKDSAVAAKLHIKWQPFNISRGRCAGAKLVYSWDPVGEEVPNVADWDLVVVNFGHHPAHRRWTQAKYRAHVSNFVRAVKFQIQLALSAGAYPRVVFMSSPPQTSREDCYLIRTRGWRTNQRIKAFNEHIQRTVRGTPLAFLDAFLPAAASASLLPCSSDRAHYDCSWVQRSLAEILMHQLFRCFKQGRHKESSPGKLPKAQARSRSAGSVRKARRGMTAGNA